MVRDRAAGNPRIRLIDLPKNRGRGYARSTGIAAAEGELIATVDADIVLPADWFVRAQAALPGHDAVGGTAVPDGDVAYVYQSTRLVPRVIGHTTTVTGSNALYRRRVFEIVGFDPALREGEDVALNQATAAGGLRFGTVPGLLVEHIENKTFGQSLRWLFITGNGATRQLINYRQIRVPDLAAAVWLASAAAGVAIAVLVSPFGLVLPCRAARGDRRPARQQPVRDARRALAFGGGRRRLRQRAAARLLHRPGGRPELAAAQAPGRRPAAGGAQPRSPVGSASLGSPRS